MQQPAQHAVRCRGARLDDGDASATAARHASARLVGRDGVEFHLGHGEWFDLLRDAGFDVERLVELYAPDDAETHPYYDAVTADWARKWPSEDLWVARKRD